MKKNTLIETLDSFGDEFDTEKLIEKLLFVEKVERGLKDVEEGKVINYKEAKQKFSEHYRADLRSF
jgi:predicted transcriptional regulator